VINRPNNINITGGTQINNTVLSQGVVNNFARPWGGYHNNWYQGSLGSGWGAFPAVWASPVVAGGYALGTQSGWSAPAPSTVVYSNPYYAAPQYAAPQVESTVAPSPSYTVPTELDYSQPIAVPTAAAQAKVDEDIPNEAAAMFDQARSSFKRRLYRSSLTKVELALKLLPGDTTMHEFRSLCQFALGRYGDSTGTLYAVLAAGPGWNWDTMASLYPDTDTYTKQLRALEQYVKDNPKKSDGHFLLAYHYLVLDQKDAAAEEFTIAAQLQPKDRLSASLASALTTKPANEESADS
jgi:tetratricopeptide (TPR) repeat protein